MDRVTVAVGRSVTLISNSTRKVKRRSVESRVGIALQKFDGNSANPKRSGEDLGAEELDAFGRLTCAEYFCRIDFIFELRLGIPYPADPATELFNFLKCQLI